MNDSGQDYRKLEGGALSRDLGMTQDKFEPVERCLNRIKKLLYGTALEPFEERLIGPIRDW